jgi:hypothetical protein
MNNRKRVGAFDSPATFSYPDLLKIVKKTNNNSPTSADTKVALPNIAVQE